MKKIVGSWPGVFYAVNKEEELAYAVDRAAKTENGVYALAKSLAAEFISRLPRTLSC